MPVAYTLNQGNVTLCRRVELHAFTGKAATCTAAATAKFSHLALFVNSVVGAAEPAREAVLEQVGERIGDVLHEGIHKEAYGQFVFRGVAGVHEHVLEDRGDGLRLVSAVAFGRPSKGIDYDLVGELAHLLRLAAEEVNVLFESNLAHGV